MATTKGTFLLNTRYRISNGVFALLISPFFGMGCSMEAPTLNGSGLKIVLEEQRRNVNLFDQLSVPPGLDSESRFLTLLPTTSTPSTIADFSCFAVNVTGPGIVGDFARLKNCTSTDNFHGHGMGIVTQTLPKGAVFELDVPAGPDRNIDVYGVYPPSSECTGTSGGTGPGSGGGSGYFLGSRTLGLSENTTVVVPVSYAAGTSGSVTCSGEQETSSGGGTSATLGIGGAYPPAGTVDGGTLVKIGGQGFVAGLSVAIGGVPCTNPSVSPNVIFCTTGAHSAGLNTLVVQNPNGASVQTNFNYTTGAHLFVYDSPTNGLSGDGEGPHDFGTASATTTHTFYLRNSGQASATGFTLGTNHSFFSLSTGSCSTLLSSGSECTFTVAFDPNGSPTIPNGTMVSAKIQINGNDARGIKGTKL